MLDKEITQHTYCVRTGSDKLLEILKRDEDYSTPCVAEQLAGIFGISRVEYDGHFGGYVFLTIDVEEDTEETWEQIEAIIEG